MSENVRSNTTGKRWPASGNQEIHQATKVWGECSRCHQPLHQVTIKNPDHPDYGNSFATCLIHGHAYEIKFAPGEVVVFTDNVPNKDFVGVKVRLLYPIAEHRDRPYIWEVEILEVPEGAAVPGKVGDRQPESIGSNVLMSPYWVARVVPELTSVEDADEWLERQ